MLITDKELLDFLNLKEGDIVTCNDLVFLAKTNTFKITKDKYFQNRYYLTTFQEQAPYDYSIALLINHNYDVIQTSTPQIKSLPFNQYSNNNKLKHIKWFIDLCTKKFPIDDETFEQVLDYYKFEYGEDAVYNLIKCEFEKFFV